MKLDKEFSRKNSEDNKLSTSSYVCISLSNHYIIIVVVVIIKNALWLSYYSILPSPCFLNGARMSSGLRWRCCSGRREDHVL